MSHGDHAGTDNPVVDDRIGPTPSVVVYWRPGCPFCVLLRRQLRRAGLPTHDVDIWRDPGGAAYVRSHARGTETVPTVDVAGTVLVNPTAKDVLAGARHAGIIVTPPPNWWRRFTGRRPDEPPAGGR